MAKKSEYPFRQNSACESFRLIVQNLQGTQNNLSERHLRRQFQSGSRRAQPCFCHQCNGRRRNPRTVARHAPQVPQKRSVPYVPFTLKRTQLGDDDVGANMLTMSDDPMDEMEMISGKYTNLDCQ
jgi:hypothetical protein